MEQIEGLTLRGLMKWQRFTNGLTLKDVAKNTGLSLQFISELEKGNKTLSDNSLCKLSKFYNLNVEDFKCQLEYGKNLLNSVFDCLLFQNIDSLIALCHKVDEHNYNSFSFLYTQIIKEFKYIFIDNYYESFSSFDKVLGELYQVCEPPLSTFYYFVKSNFYSKAPNLAIAYAKRALEKSTNMLEPLLHSNYAATLINNNELITALSELQTSTYISQLQQLYPMVQSNRLNQAIIYARLFRFSDAIIELELCKKSAELTGNRKMIHNCLINIAYSYVASREYNQAINYVSKYTQFKIDEEFQNIITLATFLSTGKKINNKYNSSLLNDLYDINMNTSKENIAIIIMKYNSDFLSHTILLNFLIDLFNKNNQFDRAFYYLSMLYHYSDNSAE